VKATGVVRRIDDLGRIVIPIEIRRAMNIRDGDPLEIFVDENGEVILKKYSAIAELGDFGQEIVDSLAQSTDLVCLLTDRDRVVAVANGPQREYLGRPVGTVVHQAMDGRRTLVFTARQHQHPGALIGEEEPCPFAAEVIAPIVVGGDPVGAVVICTRQQGRDVGDLEIKLAETAAGFLARHMEE
jgi:stage V sporulation protein T